MIEQGVIDLAVEEARMEMLEEIVYKKCDHSEAERRAEALVKDGTCSVSSSMLIDHLKFCAKCAREAKWRARVRGLH